MRLLIKFVIFLSQFMIYPCNLNLSKTTNYAYRTYIPLYISHFDVQMYEKGWIKRMRQYLWQTGSVRVCVGVYLNDFMNKTWKALSIKLMCKLFYSWHILSWIEINKEINVFKIVLHNVIAILLVLSLQPCYCLGRIVDQHYMYDRRECTNSQHFK